MIHARTGWLALALLIGTTSCPGDPPQQNPDNPQQGGTTTQGTPDWRDDETVLSPPILVPPLLNCGTAVRVRGFRPNADVRILRNGTDDIGGGVGWDPEGQMFPLDVPLETGWEITAVQKHGGATSDPSDSKTVQAIAEAYPDGLPRPEIAALPLYRCGIAALPDNLPQGGEVRILSDAQTDPVARATGVGTWQSVSINPAFVEGEDITVISTICGVDSDPSIAYTVQPPPAVIPNPVPDELRENGEILIVGSLVNGARVQIRNLTTGDVIGGGGAPAGWVRFRINPPVNALDQVEVSQELCGVTTSTTTTVQPCSDLPPPVLIGPQPGDDVVYLTGVAAGSQIIILSGSEEIGDGGGTVVHLTRPVEEGETLTVFQVLDDCVSNGTYTLDVGTGLNDPGDRGGCEAVRFEYGQNDEILYDVSSFFNSPASIVPYSMNAVPVHGIAYHPAGPGPYPLVLIVHGNHSASEPSEPGYEYLLEHLARQCMIAVSVDENFLNSVYPGAGEIDARGVVLLRHLQLWREWNQDPTSEFFTRVDLGSVMLAGHSRGGEAVTVAKKLNGWLHDPASSVFNFDFGVQSLFAIAPTEGQVDGDGSVPLVGLPFTSSLIVDSAEYFVIHGSYDGDVSSFAGHRTYDRAFPVDVSASRYKSLRFLHGANHAQFNTVWEANPISSDMATNIAREKTWAVTKTYMTALAFTSLRGWKPYRALFKGDVSFASIPSDALLVGQYQDPDRVFLLDYEDDDDPATGSLAGVTGTPDADLDPYVEIPFTTSSAGYDLKQATDGVGLGWEGSTSPELAVELDAAAAARWKDYRNLGFRIGQVNDPTDSRNTAGADQDLSVQVFWGAVPGPVVQTSTYTRLPDADGPAPSPKTIMSSVRIRWADLEPAGSGEDHADPSKIVLRFDQRPSGWLVLDEIQFTE